MGRQHSPLLSLTLLSSLLLLLLLLLPHQGHAAVHGGCTSWHSLESTDPETGLLDLDLKAKYEAAFVPDEWILVIDKTKLSLDLPTLIANLSNLSSFVNGADGLLQTFDIESSNSSIPVAFLHWKESALSMKALFDSRSPILFNSIDCIFQVSTYEVEESFEESEVNDLFEVNEFKAFNGGAYQTKAPWNLDRIDQASVPMDGAYGYQNDGTGTHVYVLDTGVVLNEGEYGDRLDIAYNAIQGETGEDCHGHGTHVCGTVGSKSWGVAKGANIHSVKVLNCNGSGSSVGIIDGLIWVLLNAQRPAIVSMSLGGSASWVDPETVGEPTAEKDAQGRVIDMLLAANINVVVAAGNDDVSSCYFTPAYNGYDSPQVTVAASTINDNKAGFSNFGKCVDIFGPGQSIKSLSLSGSSTTKSGTSMATPLVSGIMALIMEENPNFSPEQAQQELLNSAVQTGVKSFTSATPTTRRLAQNPYPLALSDDGYIADIFFVAARDIFTNASTVCAPSLTFSGFILASFLLILLTGTF